MFQPTPNAELRRCGLFPATLRILIICSFVNTAPTSADGQPNPWELEADIDELRTVRSGEAADAIVAKLARQGDVAVAAIKGRLSTGKQDFGLLHHSVRVLQQVNSAASRDVLTRIAIDRLGEGNINIERWAAQALVTCAPAEAEQLLSSVNPRVLEVALNALDGQAVDEKRFRALKRILLETPLENGQSLPRWRAAEVIGRGTSGPLAVEAVSAIGEALFKVEEIPNLDQETGGRLGQIASTLGEDHYSRYAGALASADVENAVLRGLATLANGRPKDVAKLVLARRGDESVHDDIVRLMQDPAAGVYRAWAARTMPMIGSASDLPLLQRMAESDPLERRDGSDVRGPRSARNGGMRYPVRDAAGWAHARLEMLTSLKGDHVQLFNIELTDIDGRRVAFAVIALPDSVSAEQAKVMGVCNIFVTVHFAQPPTVARDQSIYRLMYDNGDLSGSRKDGVFRLLLGPRIGGNDVTLEGRITNDVFHGQWFHSSSEAGKSAGTFSGPARPLASN
jgi:hypothetical protein